MSRLACSPTRYLFNIFLAMAPSYVPPSIATGASEYQQFGLGNSVEDFPAWCQSHFKYPSYSEVRFPSLGPYSDNKYGHLFNDTLIGRNGFKMRGFINSTPNLINDANKDNLNPNIDSQFPPENSMTYCHFNIAKDPLHLVFLVDVGTHCCGHPGIWHGGVTSAILDNTFGLFGSLYYSLAATKALTVRFLKPIIAGTPVLVSTEYVPKEESKDNPPKSFTAIANVYFPSGKVAVTSECEIVDVSNKWNTSSDKSSQ